uniref:Uncharacterized protein n=1 Tax=Anguilla anguilla TaxID=7936 RepID=A0A0E9WXF0_ANGAN
MRTHMHTHTHTQTLACISMYQCFSNNWCCTRCIHTFLLFLSAFSLGFCKIIYCCVNLIFIALFQIQCAGVQSQNRKNCDIVPILSYLTVYLMQDGV